MNLLSLLFSRLTAVTPAREVLSRSEVLSGINAQLVAAGGRNLRLSDK